MATWFDTTETTEEHKMIIDPVGFISEIINNIGDQRDIIRELISNAAAKEIGAKNIAESIVICPSGSRLFPAAIEPH